MFGLLGHHLTFPIWVPYVWNTLCQVKDQKRSYSLYWLNRKTILESSEDTELDDLQGTVFMNQISHPFIGAMTDVQVWNRSLTVTELDLWAVCNLTETGDVIDWRTADLNVTGLTRITVSQTEVCDSREDDVQMAAFNTRLNFIDSVKFCKRFGQIATASTDVLRDKMLEAFNKIENHLCSPWGFYSGTVYSPSTQSWLDLHTGEEVVVRDWYEGRPGSQPTTENCIFFMSQQRQHYDLHCGYADICPVCQVARRFQLRGVCQDSPVDVLYNYRYHVDIRLGHLYIVQGFQRGVSADWSDLLYHEILRGGEEVGDIEPGQQHPGCHEQ